MTTLLRALRILAIACFSGLCLVPGPPPSQGTRKIVVGINRDFPPYEYLDAKGQPAGYDIDLMREVAELEGLDLAFRADTWDGTLNAFREGKVDLLAGLLHSKAREAFADFSTPHLVVHYAIFVRNGDSRIQDESQLKGHRILVERQSQMHDHLRAIGLDSELIPVGSEPEALRRLAHGEADAAAAPQLEGMVLAKRDHLAIRTAGGPLMTRQLCFATQKDQVDLLSRLNTGLAILNQTGRYAEIYKTWFGALQPDPRAGALLIRRGLIVLAAVVLALILLGVWNRSLRRKVARATEQLRRANREIQDREAFLDTIIESLPVAIFGKDPRKGYAFTLWNAHSEEMFGLSRQQVMGKTDHDFFPKEQADFFRAKDEEVVRNGRPIEIQEERISSVSLGEITLHTRKVPLFDDHGPALLLGISENITERKAMEEALRQSQKLESLGILAGGIAHDFNNLLTAIMGNLGLAELHVPEDHPALPFLANAQATSLRAAELTHQMLAYSGKGLFIVKPVDLSRAAGDMASLLKVSISKKITLRFEFTSDLPHIQADPAQLQQVVMNLVTNAAEAIGEAEGEVLVATGLADLDAIQLGGLHPGSPIPPGRYVTLRVEDSGVGMAPDVLSRIFDPFFTTKFSGRGLGLSAMLGILRAHHAGIAIKSQPGVGTEFCLYFPVGEPPSGSEKADSAHATHVPEQGTVLVVEDEPDVRQSTTDMLRHAGYEVLEARDGVEGCLVYRQERPRIDLVLMDLTMPKMDGRTAAAEILAFDPKARIILTSGFQILSAEHGPTSGGLAGFLQKPFQMEDLLEILHRAGPPAGEPS
ncbi:MAG TPA: transporter substrate-binding domain-containing protein [Geothrix sp.]|nr:transporter substrate-binding domain-containing protein [Geothrix sp.]